MDAGGDGAAGGFETAAVVRGTARLLAEMGYSVLPEFRLSSRRRADLAGVDRKGGIVIVEVKVSLADFRADRKWREYLPYCDRFYFAVPPSFPRHVLPEDTGLIIADGFGGDVVRAAPAGAMNGNRRRSVTLQLARAAAQRLHAVWDARP